MHMSFIEQGDRTFILATAFLWLCVCVCRKKKVREKTPLPLMTVIYIMYVCNMAETYGQNVTKSSLIHCITS